MTGESSSIRRILPGRRPAAGRQFRQASSEATNKVSGAGAGTARYPYNYIWQVATNIVRPMILWTNYANTGSVNGNSDGHETSGYNIDWKGGLSDAHYFSQPNVDLLSQGQIGDQYPQPSVSLLNTGRSCGSVPQAGCIWDEHGSGAECWHSGPQPVFDVQRGGANSWTLPQFCRSGMQQRKRIGLSGQPCWVRRNHRDGDKQFPVGWWLVAVLAQHARVILPVAHGAQLGYRRGW